TEPVFTGPDGVATASFTANTTAGSFTVTVTTPGATGSADFSLTNLALAPANVVATAGTPQSTPVMMTFARPLTTLVTDTFGNPVGGVTVQFVAPTSGPSGTFRNGLTTEAVLTDSNVVPLTTSFVATSTPGAFTVTATTAGVAAPANFSLTNTAGAPARIAVSGASSPQTTLV